MAKPNINPVVFGGIGAGIFILIIFYFMDYSPHKKNILKLRDKKDNLSKEVMKARGVARKRKTAERMYKVVQMQWQEANRMIPGKENITDILKKLTTKGGESRVKITHFKPGKSKKEKDYTEKPIDIAMEGDYHQIAKFLSSVNNIQRVVNIENLSLTRTSIGTLSATMKATIYISSTGSKEKGGKK